MSPPAAISRLFSLMSRRGYAASARTAEGQQRQRQRASAMAARISGAEGGAGLAASGAEVSWMRDPKTGYWIPENRFGADVDVDAAELRAQLLSRKA